MPTIVVGVDGGDAGERALSHACRQANLIGDCEVHLVFVIEWSPYTFQTPEENETRHKRREEELSTAQSRVLDPALEKLRSEGISASGTVRHGDAAEILDDIAREKSAELIVVARSSETGIMSKLFGSVTGKLVMGAHVPVTVVG